MRGLRPGLRRPLFKYYRSFSLSVSRSIITRLEDLPERTYPSYHRTENDHDSFSLRWPSPPRNVLLLSKGYSQPATDALVEFARYAMTPACLSYRI